MTQLSSSSTEYPDVPIFRPKNAAIVGYFPANLQKFRAPNWRSLGYFFAKILILAVLETCWPLLKRKSGNSGNT